MCLNFACEVAHLVPSHDTPQLVLSHDSIVHTCLNLTECDCRRSTVQASTSLSVQTWRLRALSPLTMRRMHCPSPRPPSPRLLTTQADTPGTSRCTADLANSECSGPARCRCRMLANATPTRPAGRGQSGPADTCVPALSQVHDGYPTGRIMDSKTYREGYVLRYDSQTRQPKANYYDAISTDLGEAF